MAKDVLINFLNAGLFQIGSDDSRLNEFGKAAEDLSKTLAKAPEKVIPYTLIAIDPQAPVDDPVLGEAEAAVMKQWKSLRNVYAERPVNLLRPVLLQALTTACADSPKMAAAIWYSGRTVFNHLEPSGEQVIVGQILLEMGSRCEEMSRTQWTVGSVTALKLPELEATIVGVEDRRVDRPALNQAISQVNGHHNASVLFGEWAPRASEAISSAIDNATEPLRRHAATQTKHLQEAVQRYSREVNRTLVQWLSNSVSVSQRRAELLWWKEALYSTALNCSYRSLTKEEAITSMAVDFQRIAGAPAPESTEYLLREAVREVLGSSSHIRISDLYNASRNGSKVLPVLPEANLPAEPRRISLATALSLAGKSQLSNAEMKPWVGIEPELQLAPAEVAVWLYRDLMAKSLAKK
ncbi:MAG TPA: GTPase-associated system all-helical protein GASH [Flavobacteriales bacterium]